MALLDTFTGGKSSDATDAQRRAIAQLAALRTPSITELSLPELEQYAIAAGMTPAQMQAFLQQSNAYNTPVNQTGTAAQVAAINQLAGVANAGAEGSPTQRAQVEQINQDAARNLAGQRGAIEQQAAARGVPVGLLQAALSGQQAGQGLQDAHMAALQAQGQNYQQALSAMAQGGALGGQLQGQQNAQANAVAQAQNAMQQFNAANQQNASQANAANQQQANLYNTQTANQTGQANTGLANQRTQYNAQLPQQVFQNELNKATGVANQYNKMAETMTGQGKQNAGIASGLLGTAGTVIGGIYGGPVGAMVGNKVGTTVGGAVEDDGERNAAYGGMVKKGGVIEPYAKGGIVEDPDELLRRLMMLRGIGPQGPGMPAQNEPMSLRQGGMVPGRAKVPGDSLKNDTVKANLSPGELVVPRTAVPNVLGMMAERQRQPQRMPPGPMAAPVPTHHPQDVATLLSAMRHLRGAQAA